MTDEKTEKPKRPLERDAKGRWPKGVSGSRGGRPPVRKVDETELHVFGESLVNLKVGGKPTAMSRRQANRFTLFNRAMSGDVRALIFMEREFKAAEKVRAEIMSGYMDLENLRLQYLRDKKEVPAEIERTLEAVRRQLGLDLADQKAERLRRRQGRRAQPGGAPRRQQSPPDSIGSETE